MEIYKDLGFFFFFFWWGGLGCQNFPLLMHCLLK